MTEAEYIPAGSDLVKHLRRDRTHKIARQEVQRQEKRDEAEKVFLRTVAELGQLGVEMVQFEIVHPLGRLATLAQQLNPFRTNKIIRADTIRQYGNTHHYAHHHALLVPRKGFLVPHTDKSPEGKLREALFPDGTTGTVMRWDRYERGFMAYIDFSPPSEAYWCDELGNAKFSPQDTDDRFESRNCIPVWSESLRPVTDYDWALPIESLTKQVEALGTLSQVKEIVNNTPLESQ